MISCKFKGAVEIIPPFRLPSYIFKDTKLQILCDLFHLRRPSNWRKKRIHFHDFMLNVQSRLQVYDGDIVIDDYKSDSFVKMCLLCFAQKHKGVSDPLKFVADEISDEAILLCLDEFMVHCKK